MIILLLRHEYLVITTSVNISLLQHIYVVITTYLLSPYNALLSRYYALFSRNNDFSFFSLI